MIARGRVAVVVTTRRIDTPLGPMVAAATADALCLLEFEDRRALPTQMKLVERQVGSPREGTNEVLDLLEEELGAYFRAELRGFSVSVSYPGTPFQVRVWERLLRIPYGETLSYGRLAEEMGAPDGQRAVGRANGDNRLAIVIPCHRVIRSDGSLCGYGGGLWRKRKLLDLEAGQAALC